VLPRTPTASWMNSVLKSYDEVDIAVRQVQMLGLPVMSDPPKNWDSLAALSAILHHCLPTDPIFDAGGETYSVIAPWLSLYGFRNLTVGNIAFGMPFRIGDIQYQYVDITATRFPDCSFQAITCLSVIEHGVDVDLFFQEAFRLLRAGGLLIVSTDYYETTIDCRNQVAFGVPIRVFNKEELLALIDLARTRGLAITGELDPSSQDKVVYWRDYDLRYTFVALAFQKAPLRATTPI
jgi:SAM-dependent methyltransferase